MLGNVNDYTSEKPVRVNPILPDINEEEKELSTTMTVCLIMYTIKMMGARSMPEYEQERICNDILNRYEAQLIQRHREIVAKAVEAARLPAASAGA